MNECGENGGMKFVAGPMYVYLGLKGASTSKVIGDRNEMMMDDDGQMIFGDIVGLKPPDIRLTGEEKLRKKTSPRKLVPTVDRTRARCVTSAHATTRSTAVDLRQGKTGETPRKTYTDSVLFTTKLS